MRARRYVDLSVPAFAIGRFGDNLAARLESSGEIAGVFYWPVTTGDAIDAIAQSLGAEHNGHPAFVAAQDRPGAGTFAGLRVLAADDSAINREVLTEALTRLQVDVVSVENGQEAKDLVARETFDLVFMDASMPVLDGFQATRDIRAVEISAGRTPVPIVALTAHVVGSRANEWQDAGMVDCVTKPFTLAAIEACLRKWVPAERLNEKDRHGAQGREISDATTLPSTSVTPAGELPPTAPLPVLDLDVLQSIAELTGLQMI